MLKQRMPKQIHDTGQLHFVKQNQASNAGGEKQGKEYNGREEERSGILALLFCRTKTTSMKKILTTREKQSKYEWKKRQECWP